MGNESVTTRFAHKDLQEMDRFIRAGYFTNRSDMIRTAVRHYMEERIEISPLIQELAERANQLGLKIEDIVKMCRAAGKKVHLEEYGND